MVVSRNIVNTQIVGRLAPSPTGYLHLGHARSFLLAWWHARSRGGRIVLRLEDLDIERVKPGMLEATIEDLRWLGLDWDGEPYVQSSGVDAINGAAAALIDHGLAYPCTCTRREVQAAMSAPHQGEQTDAIYPGTCRGRYRSLAEAEEKSGRPAALRFAVPNVIVRIADGIQGVHEFDVQKEIGDFTVLRRLGMPAYQLAVVVDDARQGVTEIVRGADLLASCARQWLLQEALGLRTSTMVACAARHRHIGMPSGQAQRRYIARPPARRRHRSPANRRMGCARRRHGCASTGPRRGVS